MWYNYIINPKILGNSLKISPLLVIFAVAVGGAYFGFWGMFLSVPIIAVLKLLLTDYIEYKIKKKEVEIYNINDDGTTTLESVKAYESIN